MSRRRKYTIARLITYVVVIGAVIGFAFIAIRQSNNEHAIKEERKDRENGQLREALARQEAISFAFAEQQYATCLSGNRRAAETLRFVTNLNQRSAAANTATLENPASTDTQRTNAKRTLAALPAIQQQAETNFVIDKCVKPTTSTTTTTIPGVKP